MEGAVEKLRKIREELRGEFFERDDVIDGALSALLSGSHVLLIGPPGTAKSLLAHEICKSVSGAKYFQWLLTKFTTPEEIFGAVSLKGLENDEYRRVTSGKLPEADIAFLDEVFKASSSILNTLLTIMNERIFYNGMERIQVPLITLFGASNEIPSEEDELEALYDRFLLRYVVDYIREDFRFLKMIQGIIVENVLVRDPSERGEVQVVIYQSIHGYRDRARELLIQARELESYAKRPWEDEEMLIKANVEAQTKLRHIISKIDSLFEECKERGKSLDELSGVRTAIEDIQKEILNRLLSGTEEPS